MSMDRASYLSDKKNVAIVYTGLFMFYIFDLPDEEMEELVEDFVTELKVARRLEEER